MSTVLDSIRLPDDALYEVVDGEVREKEPMSAFAVQLAAVFLDALLNFLRTVPCGVASPEQLFLLRRQPALRRRPDVAFIRFDRWTPIDPTAEAWDVIPNLAVEVVSPHNTARDIEAKIVEYLAAGVEQVWVLHPETARLYVHQNPQVVHVYGEHDEVDASPVIPGFHFKLADLIAGVNDPPGRRR